jgi:hypothetical protein
VQVEPVVALEMPQYSLRCVAPAASFSPLAAARQRPFDLFPGSHSRVDEVVLKEGGYMETLLDWVLVASAQANERPGSYR